MSKISHKKQSEQIVVALALLVGVVVAGVVAGVVVDFAKQNLPAGVPYFPPSLLLPLLLSLTPNFLILLSKIHVVIAKSVSKSFCSSL